MMKNKTGCGVEGSGCEVGKRCFIRGGQGEPLWKVTLHQRMEEAGEYKNVKGTRLGHLTPSSEC